VIDYNEIPHKLGTKWTKNIAYNRTVNLGNPGGPQTWTFTSQAMGADSCTNVVVLVSQTPFADSFPNANLCYASMSGSDTAFLYMQLTPNFLSTLGYAGNDTSGQVFQKFNPPDTNDLPEHYNDSRHYHFSWTYYIDANTYFEYQKRGFESINAWGVVIIPYDSFPCLRFVIFDTLIQTMYYNNVPIYSDTSTRIVHQFVAENFSGVVCVSSQPGESNPYFTNAAVLERLTYFYTGIVEKRDSNLDNKWVIVKPNPFPKNISFFFAHKTSRPPTIEIYNVTGELIKAIKSESGITMVSWDGTDILGAPVSQGIYFYVVRSGELEATGKFVKIEQ